MIETSANRAILRNAALSILDEFNRVCVCNELTYYLFYGTLLGAVRHKGFIPWDDDIDVAMPREDYERFIEIAPSMLDERFHLQYPSKKNLWGGASRR